MPIEARLNCEMVCVLVCAWYNDRTHSTQQRQPDRYSDIEILHTVEQSHLCICVKWCRGRQIRFATIFVAFNYSKMEMERTPSGDWASAGKYGQWRFPFNFSVCWRLNMETGNHFQYHIIISELFPLLSINHLLNWGRNYLRRQRRRSTLIYLSFVFERLSDFTDFLAPTPSPSLWNRHENVNIYFMNEANTSPEPNVFYTHIQHPRTFMQTRTPSEIRQR